MSNLNLVFVCCRCIKRLLDNWEPLRHLFLESSKKKEDSKKRSGEESIGISNKKVESITNFLRSPTNKLFTHFLSYTLKVYDEVLIKLQAEEPLVHQLQPALESLLRRLLSRFVKPSALQVQLSDVKYHSGENQKANEELMVGEEARKMVDNPKEYNLKPERIAEFYLAVRAYFEATCKYLLQKLPLTDPLLKCTRVIDPSQQLTAGSQDLRFFIKQFPVLLPQGATAEQVEEQFAEYQSTDVKACVHPNQRVDQFWVELSKRHPQFFNLCYVMLGICTIPHSSAACERVFSCVRKTCTDSRSLMTKDTVEALLVVKSNSQKPHTNEQLQQLKSAYTQSLQKYKAT